MIVKDVTNNIDLNIKTINNTTQDIDLLYKELGEAFYNTTNEVEDNSVTKQLLCAIRDHNITDKQITMLLKGISKHMEDHRKIFNDNGLILTSCIFKDNVFKIEKLSNYNEHKDIVVQLLGDFKLSETPEKDLKPTVIKMPVKNKIKYIKQAMEVLKNNETARFKEVYDSLKVLIDRASERTLLQSHDFLRTILITEYDAYEKIEAIALLLERKESLFNEVLKEIFLTNYNVRNKVDLIFSLIVYIKRGNDCNYQLILTSIDKLKKESFVHKATERYLNVLENEVKQRMQ